MFNTGLVTTSIKDHIVKGLTDLWWRRCQLRAESCSFAHDRTAFWGCGFVFVWRSCTLLTQLPSVTKGCNPTLAGVYARYMWGSAMGLGLDPATEKLCWLAWHHPQAPYAPGKTWKVPFSIALFLADFGTQQLPSRAWQQEGSRAAVASSVLSDRIPRFLILIYNIFIICNHHFFRGSKANEI